MINRKTFKPERLVDKIIEKQPKLIDYDLNRLKIVLSRLGAPHSGLKDTIHVAGTNGKGSTVASLQALLRGHGFSVNSFTSPHLIKLNERINIDGINISDEKLSEFLLEIIEVKNDVPLSYFEILTCACFMAFNQTKADFNLIEVGLGGKKDATNVIEKPMASLITPISLDHKEFLGAKLSNIATEKAGIIKKNVPVFLGKQNECVAEIIKERADSLECPLFEHGRDWKIEKLSGKYFLRIKESQISMETKSLHGDYQLENSALAIGTMYYLNLLNFKHAKRNLEEVVWPGRFQYLKKGPLCDQAKVSNVNNQIIIDGAHNPAGARALSREIRKKGCENFYLVLAMQKNKDLQHFISKFDGLAKKIYFITNGFDNFYTYTEAQKVLKTQNLKIEQSFSACSAVNAIVQNKQPNLILITGSLHLVGDILKNHS